MARQAGWKCILRIEDLDGPRVKCDADLMLLADLKWLGVDWDGAMVRQSDRADVYRAAVHKLLEAGLAYPCICTRKEIELAASAPHAEDGSAVYPGTCRNRFATLADAREAAGGREPAIRFRVPSDESAIVAWDDRFRGPQRIDVRSLGDFVISKADGTAAYQLAVVVDDAEAGITQVVRGDDLVDSTPRQILLYRSLGFAEHIPSYHHLPLVVGPDGRRLAKRHGDSRLSYYREQGVEAGRVRSLLARWSSWLEVPELCSPAELVERLRPDNVQRTPIVFSQDDDRWLRKVR